MPDDEIDISVVIVTYKTRAMTLDCLKSLFDELPERSEVIVVDNASGDGTAEAIAQKFPSVRLIESERNVGFGAGNNLAMKTAIGKFFLLLNTDAFLKPSAISAMKRYLDKRPEAAMVGPRLLNRDGSLQRSCYRFPSPARAWLETLWISGLFGGDHFLGDYRWWKHDREQAVDWVVGACCLLRRSVFERVGGFDERFFMYAEETDWQRRIRDAGWSIGFTPAGEVIHLGGASGSKVPSELNPAFFDSRDFYELKHHGKLGLLFSRLADSTGCLIRLPCWLALMLLKPSRRVWLSNKAMFSWKLMQRQLTDWSVLKETYV